jgi:hypothetical protein
MSRCLSVCPSAWNSSAPTRQILMKIHVKTFFENLLRKQKFEWKPTRITGTLHEDVTTFMTISRWILRRMRDVSNKCCRENQNTHFVFHNVFFRSCAVYEIMSKNTVVPKMLKMTMWRCVACWISKAPVATRMHTNIHAHACTTHAHTNWHRNI